MRKIVALFLSLSCGLTYANESTNIYWTDQSVGKIQSANLDGSDIKTLVQLDSYPLALNFDSLNRKLYWLEQVKGIIKRSNIDGSEVEQFMAEKVGNTTAMSVYPDLNKVIWANRQQGKVFLLELSTSNITSFSIPSSSKPLDIKLDPKGKKIYWSSGDKKIQRADLDGSSIEDVVTQGLNMPFGLAIDSENGFIYWADLMAGKIQRSTLDGQNIETLIQASGLIAPHEIELDLLNKKIYWTDRKEIRRSNLDGTQIETVIDNLNQPVGLALGYRK